MYYPYDRFLVQPAGKVVKVTVTGRAYPNSDHKWLYLEKGPITHEDSLYETAEAALLARKSELEQQQEKINKMQANLTKRFKTVCDELTRVRLEANNESQ